MPIFAKEVLTLGPWGLGLLRAAPGIGAITVAVILAFKPIRHHAGLLMFTGVGLFGISTVVFGLSQTAWLSIAALVVMGASDMVSVYVRETLIALWTPDEVRGRVNAVNMVFVGASNEPGRIPRRHHGACRRGRAGRCHRRGWHACSGGYLGARFLQAAQDRQSGCAALMAMGIRS